MSRISVIVGQAKELRMPANHPLSSTGDGSSLWFHDRIYLKRGGRVLHGNRPFFSEGTVKQQGKKQRPEGTIQYVAQPVMIGHNVDAPDAEPLFANHFELMVSNTDIFLDIGIIDPRDMQAMIEAAQKRPGEVPNVKFSVLQRVAMSPATFAMLAAKTNATMQLFKEQMNARQTQNATE